MRLCIQRVKQASVTVAGDVVGEIQQGLLVLLGVAHGDTEQDAHKMADKVCRLRIFEDDDGKMNRSVMDIHGGVLVVSQFTLLGDCRKGRRPSFIAAAAPDIAERLYQQFSQYVAAQGIAVANGIFRAQMDVALINDGPVTLILESAQGFVNA